MASAAVTTDVYSLSVAGDVAGVIAALDGGADIETTGARVRDRGPPAPRRLGADRHAWLSH